MLRLFPQGAHESLCHLTQAPVVHNMPNHLEDATANGTRHRATQTSNQLHKLAFFATLNPRRCGSPASGSRRLRSPLRSNGAQDPDGSTLTDAPQA